MAYQPDLEESNRVQRDAYARNPVSSGTATRPFDYAKEFPANPDARPAAAPVAREPSGVSQEFGGDSTGESFIGSAVAARSQPATNPGIVVTPAATQPRVSTPTYGNEGRGNGQPNVIEEAVGKVGGIIRNGNSFSGSGADPNQPVAPYDREGTQAKLDVLNRNEQLRNAANAQAQNNSLTDHLATTDRLQAGQDLVRAESEARVAKFRAVNGADVVLAGPGRRAAAAELSKQAAAADANVTGLKAKATGAITPTGNVLQDELAQREAMSRGQLADAGSTRANADANLSTISGAVQKQTLEQQKQITSLGSTLASEKDPAKREQASRSLLTLMGKDKPEDYQVIHAAGATSIGPDGFTPLKGADNIVIVNKRTGQREIVPLGAQGNPQAGAAGAAPKEGEVRTDPVSKQTRKYVNGQWVQL